MKFSSNCFLTYFSLHQTGLLLQHCHYWQQFFHVIISGVQTSGQACGLDAAMEAAVLHHCLVNRQSVASAIEVVFEFVTHQAISQACVRAEQRLLAEIDIALYLIQFSPLSQSCSSGFNGTPNGLTISSAEDSSVVSLPSDKSLCFGFKSDIQGTPRAALLVFPDVLD